MPLLVLQLASLAGAALSVAVDWVGRAVYWSELDAPSVAGSVVRKLPLDGDGHAPTVVVRRHGVIRQIAVAPLNRLARTHAYSETQNLQDSVTTLDLPRFGGILVKCLMHTLCM